MRFATGVDDDRGSSTSASRRPLHRPRRARGAAPARAPQPDPWEALAAAITEQLIEFERAVAIQRRMIAVLGRRCPDTGLRDAPPPAAVAGEAPARLASFDLRRTGPRRCAARARGGARARRPAPTTTCGACARSPGSATGRSRCSRSRPGPDDQIPAGDLGYIKLVGRITTGRPKARADNPEVRGFFERYGECKGLAGEYLRCAAARPARRCGLVEPLAGQELVGQRPASALGSFFSSPRSTIQRRRRSTRWVLVAERAVVVLGEEGRRSPR